MKDKTWYWIGGVLLVVGIIGAFLPEDTSSESQLELGEATYSSNTGSSSTGGYSPSDKEFTPISTESSDSKKSSSSESSEPLDEPVQEQEEPSNYPKVTYIVDGDTLEIDTGERVRLICIDTPERGEYYYSEAKDYLELLVFNQEVDLVKDISETDRYGRILRYIYLTDGTFVNELIVKQGYARAYPYSPDTTLCPQIKDAEQYAKDNDLGIWAEEEEQEEQEPEQTSNIICSYNAYNCGDFSSCSEVMEVFNACSSDIHRLDGDDDGIPCESLCG